MGVQMPYRSPPKVDAAVMAEIYETSDIKPLTVDRTTHEDEKFWYPREPTSEKNRDIISQMSAAPVSREKKSAARASREKPSAARASRERSQRRPHLPAQQRSPPKAVVSQKEKKQRSPKVVAVSAASESNSYARVVKSHATSKKASHK